MSSPRSIKMLLMLLFAFLLNPIAQVAAGAGGPAGNTVTSPTPTPTPTSKSSSSIASSTSSSTSSSSSSTSSKTSTTSSSSSSSIVISSSSSSSSSSASATPSSYGSSYWYANIKHQGTVWGNSNSSYAVFRNVKDPKYGAKGDGVTDDTAAIQAAVADGNRCGQGCQSSTTSPAIVFFPPGTYVISSSILMYYETQMVGDPNNLPVLKATSSFTGYGVLDADPYGDYGINWYLNTNNFFRQVRNFVIDITNAPDTAVGIHWQVAQATSLQNLRINMAPGSSQKGMAMDNGSGGFLSDITFTGGAYGAFMGNQQFTTRNLTFNGCSTAVYMAFNWGWVLSGLNIQNAKIGVDTSNAPNVGSTIISDSNFGNAVTGVKTAYNINSGILPNTNGTLILDNVDLSGTTTPIQGPNGAILSTPQKVTAYAIGQGINGKSGGQPSQGAISGPIKNANLLNSAGNIFSRSKPQYADLPASKFLSAKSFGCKGDGVTDDTAKVQAFLNYVAFSGGMIAFFDHGSYLVFDTISVPFNVKITGEVWPQIVANGPSFSDPKNPKPVFQVGNPGDVGTVEISDMLFTTKGPATGAIMVEWNLNSAKGASGMWDTHVRIGGAYGTGLQADTCAGTPTTVASANCAGVFAMFDASPSSGNVYLENTWFWVADHDMEIQNQTQVSIYSARGALFRSENGPAWLWGTSSEHSMFYNYQFSNVTSTYGLFAGFIQSETPYFQPNPNALGTYFVPTHPYYDDPTFLSCSSTGNNVPCQLAYGLRVVNSQDVLIYGTGLYSLFDNYSQTCIKNNLCQEYMIQIINSQVDAYAVSTKGSYIMITDDANVQSPLYEINFRDNFCGTIAYYFN